MSEIDILLTPVGRRSTIDATAAAEVVSLLEPKVVIPMHYKTAAFAGELDATATISQTNGDHRACTSAAATGDAVNPPRSNPGGRTRRAALRPSGIDEPASSDPGIIRRCRGNRDMRPRTRVRNRVLLSSPGSAQHTLQLSRLDRCPAPSHLHATDAYSPKKRLEPLQIERQPGINRVGTREGSFDTLSAVR